VIQGLNPQDVNALTASLIQIMQGQGGTIESLLSKTSSFSTELADNNQVVESLIDELRTVLGTLAKDGDRFSGAVDRIQQLVSGLNEDRDPIGTAITALDNGTASLADFLGNARQPLAATIAQVNRLATNIDADKAGLDQSLQKAPENFRKAVGSGPTAASSCTTCAGHHPRKRSAGPHCGVPVGQAGRGAMHGQRLTEPNLIWSAESSC
jgi:phospholipid/cholesterol/gamma-HCH transport system substrate-binding protein